MPKEHYSVSSYGMNFALGPLFCTSSQILKNRVGFVSLIRKPLLSPINQSFQLAQTLTFKMLKYAANYRFKTMVTYVAYIASKAA